MAINSGDHDDDHDCDDDDDDGGGGDAKIVLSFFCDIRVGV